MSNEKRVQQAVDAFMNGKSCSQAVFCVYGPALGIAEEAALRISGAFGGGMGNLSEACGAATGAFMAIGAKGLPKEETYKLVTSIRGNSIHNYISTESPIGKAIFGHKAGETVKVKVSDDYSYELVIRKIEDTTDDEEDKIRAF